MKIIRKSFYRLFVCLFFVYQCFKNYPVVSSRRRSNYLIGLRPGNHLNLMTKKKFQRICFDNKKISTKKYPEYLTVDIERITRNF